MNQPQFQRATGLDESLAARWFVHIAAGGNGEVRPRRTGGLGDIYCSNRA